MKLSPTLRAAASTPKRPESVCFVLQGVARTFLPSDVHAALEEIGGTRSGAPKLVTRQPAVFAPLSPGHVSAPPPATQSFHLTFPSPESAKLARLAIDRSPARFLGFPAGPSHQNGEKKTPAAAAPSRRARTRVAVRVVEEDATRWLMGEAAKEWLTTDGRRQQARNGRRDVVSGTQQDQAAAASAAARSAEDESIQQSILDSAVPSRQPSSPQGNLAAYLSAIRHHNPAPFDPAKRGLQVLLRGVPESATEEGVRSLGRGFKIDDTYGIWRVPKLAADKTAIHIISLPSVSEAHRFVRAVHNRRYGGQQFEREYVMRAEVVW